MNLFTTLYSLLSTVFLPKYLPLYSYRYHGLDIRSSLEFPELESSVFNTCNLLISEGSVAGLLPDGTVQEQGSLFEDYLDFRSGTSGTLLSIKDIGHIWISTTGEIVIDRLPGASKEGIRFFILGTALGIFLLQKGAFPMHGSTVTGKGKSLMFVGPSGAGKSTMSTYWLDNGYTLRTTSAWCSFLHKIYQ